MAEFLLYLSQLDIYKFVTILAIVFPIYILLCGRFAVNILDPLVQFIVFNSFSISLVLYLFINGEVSNNSLTYFMLSNVFFWLGYGTIHHYYGGIRTDDLNKLVSILSRNQTVNTLSLMGVLLVSSMCLLFALRGVPLLQSNPSDAKVLLFIGGFGPVRYLLLNFPKILIGASSFFLILHYSVHIKAHSIGVKTLIYISLGVTTILLLISSGSKAALLNTLASLSLILFYIKGIKDLKKLKIIKLVIITVLVLAVVYATLVASLTASNSNSNETEGAWLHLVTRFIASGDTFFFYYKYNLSERFHNIGLVPLISFLLTPIGTIFRLTQPDFPLGSYLLHYGTGYPLGSFGPNAQLPVVTNAYLGELGVFWYPGLIGAIVAFLRVGLVRYLSALGSLGVILYLYTFASAFGLYIDINYSVQTLFMLLFFTLPIWVAIQVFHHLSSHYKRKMELL